MLSALIIFVACNSGSPCLDGYLKNTAGKCVIDDSYTGDVARWSVQNIEHDALLELGIPNPLVVSETYLTAMYARDVDCPTIEPPSQAVDDPVFTWDAGGELVFSRSSEGVRDIQLGEASNSGFGLLPGHLGATLFVLANIDPIEHFSESPVEAVIS